MAIAVSSAAGVQWKAVASIIDGSSGSFALTFAQGGPGSAAGTYIMPIPSGNAETVETGSYSFSVTAAGATTYYHLEAYADTVSSTGTCTGMVTYYPLTVG
jgi:hypothetical protein